MDPADPSQSTVDPFDIPLPESPIADDVSPAAIGLPAASPTVPAAAQDAPAAFLAWCHRFIIAILNIFVPAPVRQNWILIFTAAYTKIAAYPTKHLYGSLALIASIALAEWQQPGCVPRPRHLSNAVFGFLCATLLIFGVLATVDFIETQKWPWQQDGWVWPWQAWLWQGNAYDPGASTNTWMPDPRSPSPASSPFVFGSSPPVMPSSSTTSSTRNSDTPIKRATRFDFSMPPPPTISRPSIVIPPTPKLPGGLRPFDLPPPTPIQIHKSGIIGESPMGRKFGHFSGDYFKKKHDEMKAIAEWSSSSNKPLSAFMKPVVPEKRGGEDHENEKTVKKSFMPVATDFDTATTDKIPDPTFAEDNGYELAHEDLLWQMGFREKRT